MLPARPFTRTSSAMSTRAGEPMHTPPQLAAATAASCAPRMDTHSSVTLEMKAIGQVHESCAPAPSEAAAAAHGTLRLEALRPIKRSVAFARTHEKDVHTLAAQLCDVGSAPSLCSNCGFSTQLGRAQKASDATTHAHDLCDCATCDI